VRQLEALRQHDLDDVAGADVLLGACDDLLVGGLGEVRAHLAGRRVDRRGLDRRHREAGDQRVDARHRGIVRRLERLAPAHVHVRHDLDLLRHVVEDEETLGEEQAGVRQPEVVGGALGQPLEGTRHLVADVADGAAREARQAGDGHGAVLREQPPERLERVVHRVAHRRAARRLDLERAPAAAPDARRLGAEETVAPPLLAALDALQEEAVRPAMYLQERRHRRLQVGQDLAADGDQVSLARERREVAARGPGGPGAQRARFGRLCARCALHSEATKACSIPSCSRRRCIISVACSEVVKRPTCTRYQVSPSRTTRTRLAS